MGYGAPFDVDDLLGQSRLTGDNDGDGWDICPGAPTPWRGGFRMRVPMSRNSRLLSGAAACQMEMFGGTIRG
jgi:hypothetical protein